MLLLIVDSEVRVEGLETLDYLDNLCQKERFTEQGDALTFESEVRQLMTFSFKSIPIGYCFQIQLLRKRTSVYQGLRFNQLAKILFSLCFRWIGSILILAMWWLF